MSKAKTVVKSVVIVLAIAFIAIQFIRPNMSNPPVIAAETVDAIAAPPEPVKAILKRSCNDCHSNTTVYPWYSKVAPASWLLANHINEGREHLNFSEWGKYDRPKQIEKLEEICEEVTKGGMPESTYLIIHWDAKLSDADKKSICDWTNTAANAAL